VLDAQFFNLAQRRARVFVVASARGWASAAAVLFERASLSGHPAPRRGEGENVAKNIAGGARKRGGFSSDDIDHVAHSLRAEGFDAGEDGTGRGTPIVPVAFGGNNTSGPIDVATAVTAHGSPHGRMDFESETFLLGPTYAIQATATRENPRSGPNGAGVQRGVAYTLEASAGVQAICFDARQDPCDYGAVSGSLSSGSPQSQAVAEPHTLAIRGRGDSYNLEFREDGTANALLTPNGGRGGIGVGAIATRYAVRRLTPRECERLQGFPDDYTLVPYRGKPAKDGPRYKALGNSKAVPVVRWIGRRIEEVDQIFREQAA